MWLEEQTTRSGELLSRRQVIGLSKKRHALTKAYPPAEREFSRIIRGLKREAPAVGHLLWYQRQKLISVTPEFSFFVDFYFKAFKVVVEIDGSTHRGELAREKDALRTRLIEEGGRRRVCRFWNEEVEGDPESVRRKFLEFLVADRDHQPIKHRIRVAFGLE